MRFFARMTDILKRGALCAMAAGLVGGATLAPAAATDIKRVVSPGGVEAWLVSERSVPLISMSFAFRGGTSQDPDGREGLAQTTAALLDEGAGELDAEAYQRRLEDSAARLSFNAMRDNFSGELRTLTRNRDEAFELLRLAVNEPRFDGDAVERIRAQLLARLRNRLMDPDELAARAWSAAAFPGHPYGRPSAGTLESLAAFGRTDLQDYKRRVFARANLKVAVVGDIDAETLAPLLDKVFGALPAEPELRPVPDTAVHNVGKRRVTELEVPQTVIQFGGPGLKRKDPDFMAAYIVNHILGGGAFTSRLYDEIREKRGLAYSVHTSLAPLDHAGVFVGGTATQNARAAESLELIEREVRRMGEQGPSHEELTAAKSFLTGSYALRFDTSSKIASQLVQIQLDELGIDYIDRRNRLIEAVTLDDARRIAKRLFGDGKLLSVVVGKPAGLTGATGSADAPVPAGDPSRAGGPGGAGGPGRADRPGG